MNLLWCKTNVKCFSFNNLHLISWEMFTQRWMFVKLTGANKMYTTKWYKCAAYSILNLKVLRTFSFLSRGIILWIEFRYYDQKIHQTLAHGIQKHWTLNSIHNIIPPLKKENIHLYPCPWGYDNYMNAYFQSSWEDMTLEVTVSSVKSTDLTCKTHSD